MTSSISRDNTNRLSNINVPTHVAFVTGFLSEVLQEACLHNLWVALDRSRLEPALLYDASLEKGVCRHKVLRVWKEYQELGRPWVLRVGLDTFPYTNPRLVSLLHKLQCGGSLVFKCRSRSDALSFPIDQIGHCSIHTIVDTQLHRIPRQDQNPPIRLLVVRYITLPYTPPSPRPSYVLYKSPYSTTYYTTDHIPVQPLYYEQAPSHNTNFLNYHDFPPLSALRT